MASRPSFTQSTNGQAEPALWESVVKGRKNETVPKIEPDLQESLSPPNYWENGEDGTMQPPKSAACSSGRNGNPMRGMGMKRGRDQPGPRSPQVAPMLRERPYRKGGYTMPGPASTGEYNPGAMGHSAYHSALYPASRVQGLSGPLPSAGGRPPPLGRGGAGSGYYAPMRGAPGGLSGRIRGRGSMGTGPSGRGGRAPPYGYLQGGPPPRGQGLDFFKSPPQSGPGAFGSPPLQPGDLFTSPPANVGMRSSSSSYLHPWLSSSATPNPLGHPEGGSAASSRAGSSGKKPGTSRYDTSLGVLTKKFLNLLDRAPLKELDLNMVVEELSVQKRRLYDITNVLEGIGLIKKSKNKVIWKGSDESLPDCDKQQIEQLKSEMESMKKEEDAINIHIDRTTTLLRKQAESDKRYMYLTHDDITTLECFQGDAIIAIKAPSGTTLEVPDPEEGLMTSGKRKFQVYLRSKMGAVDVYLLSKLPDLEGQSGLIRTEACNAPASASQSSPPSNKQTKSQSTNSAAATSTHCQGGPSSEAQTSTEAGGSSVAEELPSPYAAAPLTPFLSPSGPGPYAVTPARTGATTMLTPRSTASTFDPQESFGSNSWSQTGMVKLSPIKNDEDFNYTMAESEGISDLFVEVEEQKPIVSTLAAPLMSQDSLTTTESDPDADKLPMRI